MGLLLSRQRTQPHQHDAELLSTLKQIEHQLVTLIQEQRQFYEESVQRTTTYETTNKSYLEGWINVQTQWRQEDIAWREAEQARVWKLAEEAKAHARYMSELAMQEVKSAFLPYTGDGNVPAPPKRRRAKSVSSEQVPDTSPVPSSDNAPPLATEQANA